MDGTQVVQYQAFPQEFVRQLAVEEREQSGVHLLISGLQTCYVRDAFFYDHMTRVMKNATKQVASVSEIQEPVIKAAFFLENPHETAGELWKRLTDRYDAEYQFALAGINWLDVIPRSGGKGAALAAYMDKQHIPPEEIAVFGDNENDCSMLRLTENSYAMAHSSNKVKACAGHTCENVCDILRSIIKETD